ncbi:zinc ribbon domain-containing protein [Pseudogemmatithrix spongiicola]|uniref:Zinc ribbon domain-containing protein n=1 Tax=Pseudogemmatithrix spongiicola TaxID=3062599 RepID=A0AA49K163_9BACT|nr:zinc ribbon domain-containing protein [Gemmatimonadaceae bacterium 'strain 138']WKW15804.1 zinc ribbon domain-containing protein [Gemmatimonadaceae bacterium 'strain 318']
MDRTIYQRCQSCGMPMGKGPEKRGTEADGSPSPMYCGLCYANGRFFRPDDTAEQMKDFVVNILTTKQHWPRFLARWAAREIPKLKRWQP